MEESLLKLILALSGAKEAGRSPTHLDQNLRMQRGGRSELSPWQPVVQG